MRQLLQDLFDLLVEQKTALENMIGLSYEERHAIIRNDSEEIEKIVHKELRELSRLGAIEKKRAALHPAICDELGLPATGVTVSAIASSAMPDEREAYKKLQTELTQLIDRHTNLNLENRELIKEHLEYTESVLELMVDPEDPLNNFYGGDGKAVREKKRSTGFFDKQA